MTIELLKEFVEFHEGREQRIKDQKARIRNLEFMLEQEQEILNRMCPVEAFAEKVKSQGEPGIFHMTPQGDGRTNLPMTESDLADALRAIPQADLAKMTLADVAVKFQVTQELAAAALRRAYNLENADPVDLAAEAIRAHPEGENRSAFWYAQQLSIPTSVAQDAYKRVFSNS